MEKARGIRELRSYAGGTILSARKAILAKCADCTNFYGDGKIDCGVEECPLYPYMPYQNKVKPVKKQMKAGFMGGLRKKTGVNTTTPGGI